MLAAFDPTDLMTDRWRFDWAVGSDVKKQLQACMRMLGHECELIREITAMSVLSYVEQHYECRLKWLGANARTAIHHLRSSICLLMYVRTRKYHPDLGKWQFALLTEIELGRFLWYPSIAQVVHVKPRHLREELEFKYVRIDKAKQVA